MKETGNSLFGFIVLFTIISSIASQQIISECFSSGTINRFQLSYEGINVTIFGNHLVFQGCDSSYHHFRMSRFFNPENFDEKVNVNFTEMSARSLCRNSESNLYSQLILSADRLSIFEKGDGEHLQLLDAGDLVVIEFTPRKNKKLDLFRIAGFYRMSLNSAIFTLNFNQPNGGNFIIGGCHNTFGNFLFPDQVHVTLARTDSANTCEDNQAYFTDLVPLSGEYTIIDNETCSFRLHRNYTQFQSLNQSLIATAHKIQEVQTFPISISGNYTFYFRRLKPLVVSLSSNRIDFEGCRKLYSSYSHPEWNRVRFEAFYTYDSNYCENDVDAEYVAFFHQADIINNLISGVTEYQDRHGYPLFSTVPMSSN